MKPSAILAGGGLLIAGAYYAFTSPSVSGLGVMRKATASSSTRAAAATENDAPLACSITDPELYYRSHFQTDIGRRDSTQFDRREVDLNGDKEPELLLRLKSMCAKLEDPACLTLILQKTDAVCYRVIGEFAGSIEPTTQSYRGYLQLKMATGKTLIFDPLSAEYVEKK